MPARERPARPSAPHRTQEPGELALIERLATLFGAQKAAGVSQGIGDDAAVLFPVQGRELVWTVDAQVDGRHFRREWLTMQDVGWRSFIAALSDLFAMGADPWCALASLGIPADLGVDAVDALTQGQANAARAAVCAIVGGNLTRAGELTVTTTLLGTVEAGRAVLRSGARLGDGIWLAGDVGLAAAGLRALRSGYHGTDLDDALEAFRRPRVLATSGRVLAAAANGAIDISDGLAQDAGHIARASGVALVLDVLALELHAGDPLARAARAVGQNWLDLVVAGGEDYALLATASEPLEGFTRVGDVEAGAGVFLRDRRGARRLVDARGYDHFLDDP